VATFSNVDHALVTEPTESDHVSVLIVTSDRGLAGAYSSSVIMVGERLVE
jgi:F-type H+-transporting ATPase subunit gamma